MAEINIKLAGNKCVCFTLAIVTFPSSIGCLNASKVFLLNYAISSKNKIPLCASDISPGIAKIPPPIKEFIDALWCGALKGLSFIKLPLFLSKPATL